MTNQEMNEAVARKLRVRPRDVDFETWPPPYSTDISAAWEIVEKLKATELVALCFHDGHWHCEINCCDGERPIDEEGDTAPMAICLAFLELK